ncbi:hypothetical protein AAIR98_001432 [Elusimicrobium simillimum]|uniref:hypothetical protein n=1 Tax=Elusimicrobium simillimum TaxID=3143438 RepID=UPI003C704708
MCTPTAIMGTQAAGGLTSMAGSYISGRAQQSYYNSMADSLESQTRQNDLATERQIDLDAERGAYQYGQINKEGKKIFGQQKVAMAAAGMDLSSVSAEDIIRDSAYNQILDQDMLRYNTHTAAGEKRLANKLTNINLKSQATQARLAGKNAKIASNMEMYSTMLNTGATVGYDWYKMKKEV